MSTRLRVLLLEDSEDDAMLLLRELRRSGFDPVWERHESASALAAALAREDWDIVLSDYHMPAFSALAVLKLVQEHGFDLPVIVVSGEAAEEAIAAALEAGARDYISKNNLSNLGRTVRRELGRVAASVA